MLFCSSESKAGAACASVNESGELELAADETFSRVIPAISLGRWVVTHQKPPTNNTTNKTRRNRILFQAFQKTPIQPTGKPSCGFPFLYCINSRAGELLPSSTS